MKYAVVYSSVTNNTKRLAETIKETVGAEFCGKFSDEALEAEVLLLDFGQQNTLAGRMFKDS